MIFEVVDCSWDFSFFKCYAFFERFFKLFRRWKLFQISVAIFQNWVINIINTIFFISHLFIIIIRHMLMLIFFANRRWRRPRWAKFNIFSFLHGHFWHRCLIINLFIKFYNLIMEKVFDICNDLCIFFIFLNTLCSNEFFNVLEFFLQIIPLSSFLLPYLITPQ